MTVDLQCRRRDVGFVPNCGLREPNVGIISQNRTAGLAPLGRDDPGVAAVKGSQSLCQLIVMQLRKQMEIEADWDSPLYCGLLCLDAASQFVDFFRRHIVQQIAIEEIAVKSFRKIQGHESGESQHFDNLEWARLVAQYLEFNR